MRAMQLIHFLRLASDATLFALCGGALLTISLIAIAGDWRRRKRRNIDKVGWVPWRDVAALSSFAGLVLLAFAGIGWLQS